MFVNPQASTMSSERQTTVAWGNPGRRQTAPGDGLVLGVSVYPLTKVYGLGCPHPLALPHATVALD